MMAVISELTQTGEKVELPSLPRRGAGRSAFNLKSILGVFSHAIGPVWQIGPMGIVGIILGLATLASVIITYLTFSGLTPFGADRKTLLALLAGDLAIVLSVAVIITWRLISLWRAGRRGEVSSKLHLRMVTLFSAVAIIPAIIVAIFSGVTTTISMNALLGEPVPTAIENSATMARYYVDQQVNLLKEDLAAMATSLNNTAPLLNENPELFTDFMKAQTQGRQLSSAYLVNGKGEPIIFAESGDVPKFSLPNSKIMEQANLGKITIFTDFAKNSQITGIFKIPAFEDGYLIISRRVEQRVIDHLTQMKKFIVSIDEIEANRYFVELIFVLTYIAIALLVLLGAIWLGRRAATNLVAPIGALVSATEKVSEGDFSTHVDTSASDDEIGILGQTFNRMTGQLQTQRNDLLRANVQLEERRHFTETVLAGVSSGVLGLDSHDRITIANRSAANLLGRSEKSLTGRKIKQIIPEMSILVDRAKAQGTDFFQEHLTLTLDGQTRNFNVQVTGDMLDDDKPNSLVVTFDDITKLVSAQRTAAWADVARRIAHEIKNPLTPIQLSAERLKRKYAEEVVSDRPVFEQCTDTIIRQVKDIGRMVDEFSAFAKMPAPVMREEDLIDLIKRTVFPQRVAHPDIDYQLSLPHETLVTQCDGRLIGQALTNLLKNAAEAIAARHDLMKKSGADDDPGHVDVVLLHEGKCLKICVDDNGCGLPAQGRERLTEPYITTRKKGTGLGLAIVKKIMEDHRGELILCDAPDLPGARVVIAFPLRTVRSKSAGFFQEKVHA